MTARVGIIGTGRMGTAIAKRLIETGHDVSAWNRSPGKTADAVSAGAQNAASLADLVADCGTLISSLTDATAVSAALDEAIRRGIWVEVIDAEAGEMKMSHGGRSVITRESLSEYTSAVAMSRCDDKRLTRRIVSEAGIAVPRGRLATFDQADHDFLAEVGDVVAAADGLPAADAIPRAWSSPSSSSSPPPPSPSRAMSRSPSARPWSRSITRCTAARLGEPRNDPRIPLWRTSSDADINFPKLLLSH